LRDALEKTNLSKGKERFWGVFERGSQNSAKKRRFRRGGGAERGEKRGLWEVPSFVKEGGGLGETEWNKENSGEATTFPHMGMKGRENLRSI